MFLGRLICARLGFFGVLCHLFRWRPHGCLGTITARHYSNAPVFERGRSGSALHAQHRKPNQVQFCYRRLCQHLAYLPSRPLRQNILPSIEASPLQYRRVSRFANDGSFAGVEEQPPGLVAKARTITTIVKWKGSVSIALYVSHRRVDHALKKGRRTVFILEKLNSC